MTQKAKDFMEANDASRVIEGWTNGKGEGGTYLLENGQTWRLTLADCRALPEDYPKWKHEDTETTNADDE